MLEKGIKHVMKVICVLKVSKMRYPDFFNCGLDARKHFHLIRLVLQENNACIGAILIHSCLFKYLKFVICSF